MHPALINARGGAGATAVRHMRGARLRLSPPLGRSGILGSAESRSKSGRRGCAGQGARRAPSPALRPTTPPGRGRRSPPADPKRPSGCRRTGGGRRAGCRRRRPTACGYCTRPADRHHPASWSWAITAIRLSSSRRSASASELRGGDSAGAAQRWIRAAVCRPSAVNINWWLRPSAFCRGGARRVLRDQRADGIADGGVGDELTRQRWWRGRRGARRTASRAPATGCLTGFVSPPAMSTRRPSPIRSSATILESRLRCCSGRLSERPEFAGGDVEDESAQRPCLVTNGLS